MPLYIAGNEKIITAHASKKSTVNLKITEAHTSVLVPLLILPVFPFLITLKISLATILVLILLERRGWTLVIALKRMRSVLAGRHRYKKTKTTLRRYLNS